VDGSFSPPRARGKRGLHSLPAVAAAAAGALLGALAARLVADLWPLPDAASLESPAGATGLWWLWSPFFPLAGALLGALALPLL